tara:strand:- start:192 stop:650 length:459 start_codon:yes stop_codon:yes gene_type:complete
MKILISLYISLFFLTSCGFTPIYGSKDSNFEIIEFKNKNLSRGSNLIERSILSTSKSDAIRKLKLELDHKEKVEVILKDNKGNPSKYKIVITADVKVLSEKNTQILKRNFIQEFGYDVQSDKFSMAEYEENIKRNLNNKIATDIIFLITTFK